jgi:hypothetical protein
VGSNNTITKLLSKKQTINNKDERKYGNTRLSMSTCQLVIMDEVRVSEYGFITSNEINEMMDGWMDEI